MLSYLYVFGEALHVWTVAFDYALMAKLSEYCALHQSAPVGYTHRKGVPELRRLGHDRNPRQRERESPVTRSALIVKKVVSGPLLVSHHLQDRERLTSGVVILREERVPHDLPIHDLGERTGGAATVTILSGDPYTTATEASGIRVPVSERSANEPSWRSEFEVAERTGDSLQAPARLRPLGVIRDVRVRPVGPEQVFGVRHSRHARCPAVLRTGCEPAAGGPVADRGCRGTSPERRRRGSPVHRHGRLRGTGMVVLQGGAAALVPRLCDIHGRAAVRDQRALRTCRFARRRRQLSGHHQLTRCRKEAVSTELPLLAAGREFIAEHVRINTT
ncbi:hypothetical protein [Streptomyces sp. AS58]|nr:hypothetical protein [Streptomyces sp. AS58]